MVDHHADLQYLKKVFHETEILRKPVHRIISGYHQLPYILLGHSTDSLAKTVQIRGVIHVSPRMILRPGEMGQTYGEVFGENDIEEAIVARVFGFFYLKERATHFSSEDLTVVELNIPFPEATERIIDELDRKECLDTGIIRTPDIGMYPVSVDRYIKEMLNKELSAGAIR